MSTETNTNPIAAVPNAAPAQQPATPPATAATQSTAPSVQSDDPNPPWLAERLARERKNAAKEVEANARKALLAELGFDDPEVAKKLASDEKKRQEAQKSLEQRVTEREIALKAKDDRNRELEESVKSYAEGQLAGLTEQQKAAVIAVAGTDPPKQLKAIEALRPTWAIVSTSSQSASVQNANAHAQGTNGSDSTNQANVAPPVVQSAAAKPATATAPSPNAPPPAGVSVTPNHLENYNAMNSDPKSPSYAPFAAAQYYQRYSTEIDAARQARSRN